MNVSLTPFWLRRHRVTRVLAAASLVPVIFLTVVGIETWKGAAEVTRLLPGLFSELWNTPRER